MPKLLRSFASCNACFCSIGSKGNLTGPISIPVRRLMATFWWDTPVLIPGVPKDEVLSTADIGYCDCLLPSDKYRIL